MIKIIYFFIISLFSSVFAPSSDDRFSNINLGEDSIRALSQAATDFKSASQSAGRFAQRVGDFAERTAPLINNLRGIINTDKPQGVSSESLDVISSPVRSSGGTTSRSLEQTELENRPVPGSIAKAFGSGLGGGLAKAAGKAAVRELTKNDELGGIDLEEFKSNIEKLKDSSNEGIDEKDWDVITNLRKQRAELLSQKSGKAATISQEKGNVDFGYVSRQLSAPANILETQAASYVNTSEDRLSGFGGGKQAAKNDPSIAQDTINEAIRIIDRQLNDLSKKELVALDYLNSVKKQINAKELKKNTKESSRAFFNEIDIQINNIQKNQAFDISKLTTVTDDLIKARKLTELPSSMTNINKKLQNGINTFMPTFSEAASKLRIGTQGINPQEEGSSTKTKPNYESSEDFSATIDLGSIEEVDPHQGGLGEADDSLLMDDQADDSPSRKGNDRVSNEEGRAIYRSDDPSATGWSYELSRPEQTFQTTQESRRTATQENKPVVVGRIRQVGRGEGPSNNPHHR